MRAPDYTAGESHFLWVSLRIELHKHRVSEAIHVGIEAANAVAQTLRQHRDDAIREIHAFSTPARFPIQCRAWSNVSRHIGDMDAEVPAAARQFLNVDRIVEIARVIRIDGDDKPVT